MNAAWQERYGESHSQTLAAQLELAATLSLLEEFERAQCLQRGVRIALFFFSTVL